MLDHVFRVGSDPGLEAGDVRVFLAVANRCEDGPVRLTQTEIGDLAHVSEKTVRGAVDRLEAAGYITVDTGASPHLYELGGEA